MNIQSYLGKMLIIAGGLSACSALQLRADVNLESYYSSLNGKSGYELFMAVKAVAMDHTEISYGNSTWDAFRDTDKLTIDGVNYWWDMYSNELVKMASTKPDSKVMNIEHSVANSWWGGSKNTAYKDICHLNPSNSTANSSKGNLPLGEISGTPTWTNGVTNVGTPVSGQGGNSQKVYEPCDEYKGDFARVFMYMFTVYNDINWASNTSWMYDTSSQFMFKTWAKDLLLKWHANDPVSNKERTRNDGIQKHQENRNPYIDLPDLAEYIWGSKLGQKYYVDANAQPEEPGEPEDPTEEPLDPDKTIEYNWMAETDTALPADWTIDNVELTSPVTYIWSWKSYQGLSYLNASSYVSSTPYAAQAYIYSPSISLIGIKDATLKFDHAAKFQTTCRELCHPVIRETGTTEWSELAIPTWPAAGSWTFKNSGDISLKDWIGKNVELGFKYGATSNGADTWEIRNVNLTAILTATSSIGYETDADDSFLVEVWGNSIVTPAGAHIFDLNGREVSGDNLQRGVYIVAKPSFSKSVKVFVK